MKAGIYSVGMVLRVTKDIGPISSGDIVLNEGDKIVIHKILPTLLIGITNHDGYKGEYSHYYSLSFWGEKFVAYEGWLRRYTKLEIHDDQEEKPEEPRPTNRRIRGGSTRERPRGR